MKKGVFRLCAGLLAVVLLSVAVVPCYAESDKYTSTGTFWQAVADKWYFNGTVIPAIIGTVSDKVCSESGDKKHHGSLKSYEQNPDKSYTAICDFCSAEFPVYDADLSAAYDNYVQTLPAQGYTSSGELRFRLNVDRFSDNGSSCRVISSDCGPTFSCSFLAGSGISSSYCYVIGYLSEFLAPVSGNYRLVSYLSANSPSVCYKANLNSTYRRAWLLDSHDNLSRLSEYLEYIPQGFQEYGYTPGQLFGYAVGDKIISGGDYFYVGGASTEIRSFSGYLELICIPDSLPGDTYNINTRPTSITGGNYGIVGDNGQITKVEDNSTIINETNNTFYNPATGTTVPIVNWSYDYSDRSYKVTLESGDTATITYGDENITIQETTITEGDTITNNYTIYYLIDGSGSVTPPCEHDWQEASGTDPTCTLPGKVTLSCAKCQQTKTETLPALGHDWQVKQTVTTQYDDTGQLIQEGYTIFECSRCKEQYKSPDGTIPPGGGSGTDPGGEEEDEGFLSWLLGKLGELLGTIGDGILNLLQTALDKIFGGLIDLVNSLFENLAKLVDLFGTVGEAFQVLWTWLPPEIIAILVAGVSIFVFVALLKFFMK